MIYILIIVTLLFPLKGALIRWRANFTPKVQPVPELPLVDDASQPRSLLGMLQRVNAEEGIDGLYKGILPTLGFVLFWKQVMPLPSIAVIGYLHFGVYDQNAVLIIAIASPIKIIATVIEAVFVNRAVTTREDIPSFSLRRALDALLSSTERRHPYRIFIILGLLAACTSWVLYIVGTIGARHFLFVKQFSSTFGDWENVKPLLPLLVGAVIFSFILNALVLTPLEVIMVRLSIQAKATPVTLLLDTPPAEAVGPIRIDKDEYTGLISCARLVIQEEGWGALYRGWWWTGFRGLLFI
ncbi:uncharacterized protein BJ212DRAFT_1474095 [Suillus subaureus]|uniref:Mitochondrial carrier n=1 Tax=Suillus subaureus TaxID=48587 RepID=A0A9P7EN55_9AGAM|nr:uncharacterized protein BJ212DRAFT_1474095 [Suillus subaureus]KAG1826882.1 hypothetical protein BJ212DRAFT_1474095 [Suillus subaureus]